MQCKWRTCNQEFLVRILYSYRAVNSTYYLSLHIEHRRKQIVNTAPHTPVPATTVFAREAAPLYLPDLDTFLSKLQAPSFSRFASGVRVGKKIVGSGMFPPMDQLAATGKSIVDLETNSTVSPAWRNRESIIGGISNATLSITVGISYKRKTVHCPYH